jgi:hypothetical protein
MKELTKFYRRTLSLDNHHHNNKPFETMWSTFVILLLVSLMAVSAQHAGQMNLKGQNVPSNEVSNAQAFTILYCISNCACLQSEEYLKRLLIESSVGPHVMKAAKPACKTGKGAKSGKSGKGAKSAKSSKSGKGGKAEGAMSGKGGKGKGGKAEGTMSGKGGKGKGGKAEGTMSGKGGKGKGGKGKGSN